MPQFPAFSSNIVYQGKTPAPTLPHRNRVDLVAPDVKLYIEGVQVPFTSISISQSYTNLPTASIEVPPASGLMDIIRGYQPKVHIFYYDTNYGDYRLLFWGHIVANSYHRRRGQMAGSNIMFNCVHKNALAASFTLDFVGMGNEGATPLVDPATASQGGGVVIQSLNSTETVIDAMSGIEGVAEEKERFIADNAKTQAELTALPTNKADTTLAKIVDRLYGMPGIAINLWNHVKRSGLNVDVKNIALTHMWAPLTEEGIGFFKRMSGHPLLEAKLQAAKATYCHQGTTKETKVLIAPTYWQPMMSAVQGELATRAAQDRISTQQELTSYLDMLRTYYEVSEYELLTLASPAEVPANPLESVERTWEGDAELMAVETIIKPKMPFYFSPVCNVIFPKMYYAINLSQEEVGVPTRITAFYDARPGDQKGIINFRAPHSIREAISYNSMLYGARTSAATPNLSLTSSMGYSYSIPGKYEQGTGIRPIKIGIPWWLSQMVGAKSVSTSAQQEQMPLKDSAEYDDMMLLSAAWKVRYGQNVKMEDGTITRRLDPAKAGLNYYDPAVNDVAPHERLMFATVDQEFATRFASSRVGSVECIFNPYIVPGYPMDVVDDSPNHPSFHGFCAGVTHSISSRSISTTVNMVSIMTYAELSNYYVPPIPPFLQSALDLVNGEKDSSVQSDGIGDTSQYKNVSSTLIQNPKARETADLFYKQVLGVGAAAPDDLIQFSTGSAIVVERTEVGTFTSKYALGDANPAILAASKTHSGKGTADYHTSMGNLSLVRRPIETKTSIENKFSLNFIDIDRYMYSGSQVRYVNPILASNFFLEPGASMFLDYMETEDFIKVKR